MTQLAKLALANIQREASKDGLYPAAGAGIPSSSSSGRTRRRSLGAAAGDKSLDGGTGSTPDPPSGSTSPIESLPSTALSTPFTGLSVESIPPGTPLLLSEEDLSKGCALCQARWRTKIANPYSEGGEAATPGSGVIRKSASLCMTRKHDRYFTKCDVALHDKPDDCWLYAHDMVYDATGFLDGHPGGMKSILGRGGKDASVDFDFHSRSAQRTWAEYEVGMLVSCEYAAGDRRGSCVVQ